MDITLTFCMLSILFGIFSSLFSRVARYTPYKEAEKSTQKSLNNTYKI